MGDPVPDAGTRRDNSLPCMNEFAKRHRHIFPGRGSAKVPGVYFFHYRT